MKTKQAKAIAKMIVEEIVWDLSGAAGLQDAWEALKPKAKMQVQKTWREITLSILEDETRDAAGV